MSRLWWSLAVVLGLLVVVQVLVGAARAPRTERPDPLEPALVSG